MIVNVGPRIRFNLKHLSLPTNVYTVNPPHSWILYCQFMDSLKLIYNPKSICKALSQSFADCKSARPKKNKKQKKTLYRQLNTRAPSEVEQGDTVPFCCNAQTINKHFERGTPWWHTFVLFIDDFAILKQLPYVALSAVQCDLHQRGNIG